MFCAMWEKIGPRFDLKSKAERSTRRTGRDPSEQAPQVEGEEQALPDGGVVEVTAH